MHKLEAKDLVFAKTLPVIMRKKNLSVKELSHISGVSNKSIYHWMAGQVPSLVGISKIAQALGVPVEFLAFGIEVLSYKNEPKISGSFELVLYRVTEESIREKLYEYNSDKKT